MRVIIHMLALAVPGVVAPLGSWLLGRQTSAWASLVAGVVAAPTFAFGRGVAAVMWVMPWVFLAGAMAISDVRRVVVVHRRTGSDVVITIASLFLGVSALSLLLSRLGVTVGRVGEPIVELTAVHYGFAGYGATLVAWCAAGSAQGAHRKIVLAALLATISAPPVIALGFLTGAALPQIGGAALLTVGVVSTAVVTGVDARPSSDNGVTTTLLTVCAAAPVVPMALAVLWAASQHWVVPALDIPAMARIHGSLNAIGFIGCGLVGYRRLRAANNREIELCS